MDCPIDAKENISCLQKFSLASVIVGTLYNSCAASDLLELFLPSKIYFLMTQL